MELMHASSAELAAPPRASMEDAGTSVIGRRLHDFFVDRGMPRHKHASQLALILGLSRSGAFRKFQDGAFSANDLEVMAEHFDVDVSVLLSAQPGGGMLHDDASGQRARIFIGTSLLACHVRTGPALAPGEHCDLVATRHGTEWLVQPFATAGHDQPRHRVLELAITPQRRELARVAVLEDAPELANHLKLAFEGAGFKVELFETPADMSQRAAAAPFDAYVADWWLNGETSEAALRAIRRAQPGVPMTLTTGAIASGHAIEDQIVRIAMALRLQVVEKPFRLALLISQIQQSLEELGQRNA